jgi:ATP synthase protein I
MLRATSKRPVAHVDQVFGGRIHERDVMSDKAPHDEPGDTSGRTDKAAMDDAELAARHTMLAAKLASNKRQSRLFASLDDEEPKTGYGTAVKVSSEFIAGITVGAILGFGFDRYFETSPWGLIVFLLLGFAAGVLNVLRAVGAVAKPPKL